MKIFSRLTSVFFTALLFSCQPVAIGQGVFPNSLDRIAKIYGCHADENHYKENETGVKAPYDWGVVKAEDPYSSVVFWCNYESEGIEKSKIVIHVEKSALNKYKEAIAFAQCPNEIKEVVGKSTGIWIENDAIYTGFEDGIYYYCQNGKWIKSDWD